MAQDAQVLIEQVNGITVQELREFLTASLDVGAAEKSWSVILGGHRPVTALKIHQPMRTLFIDYVGAVRTQDVQDTSRTDITGPDRFFYYRDHEQVPGAWGVRDSTNGQIVAIGLDKTDALVLAWFLSGRTEEAVRARDDFMKYRPCVREVNKK